MNERPILRYPSLSGVACGLTAFLLTACGSSTAATNDVATLEDNPTGQTETVEQDLAAGTADSALAYASCMRDNGVEMDDPTFDAEGDLDAGSLFGRGDATFDRQSEEFQTAQTACADYLEGITFGGGGQGGFDRSAIEDGLLSYTACLRDEGLSVNDISFGGGGQGADGAGAGGQAAGGQAAEGQDGNGFEGGTRPDRGEGGGGVGGAGFDPTARLIQQLDIDDTDPVASAALETCQTTLDAVFSGAAADEES